MNIIFLIVETLLISMKIMITSCKYSIKSNDIISCDSLMLQLQWYKFHYIIMRFMFRKVFKIYFFDHFIVATSPVILMVLANKLGNCSEFLKQCISNGKSLQISIISFTIDFFFSKTIRNCQKLLYNQLELQLPSHARQSRQPLL